MLTMAEPNGPVDHALFRRMMGVWDAGLREAGAVDGVYVMLRGAGLTTEDDDPEGVLLGLVCEIVGLDVPVGASFDLHANVSAGDVDRVDGFVGYRTNPHLDMRERGAETAVLLRRLMNGTRTVVASVRLPLVPPTVTMLIGADATDRPYGELIDLGQRRMNEAPYVGRVLNVSDMGGFAFADTAFNGLTAVVTAVVTATDRDTAQELAEAGWTRRDRFPAHFTPLNEAAGQGTSLDARFGRNADADWTTPARVLAVHDEPVRSRRGVFAGRRVQCADPAFLEALGVVLTLVRCLVVKSRGHFRGGFDELFGPAQIVEVDAPGLTSPVLSRFGWKHLPRPVLPLDAEVTWP